MKVTESEEVDVGTAGMRSGAETSTKIRYLACESGKESEVVR